IKTCSQTGAAPGHIDSQLPVNLSQNNVDAADCRNDVGEQSSFAHFGKELHVGQARRAHVYSIRFRRAVANDVISHLAARRLDRLINLAFGNRKTFRDDLEVIDQSFHLRLHLLAIGYHHFWSVRFNGAFRHAIEGLAYNLDGFAQLRDAAHVAREYVSVLTHRHLELEIFVPRVGHVTAKVKVNAASAQRGTARAKSNRVFGGN